MSRCSLELARDAVHLAERQLREHALTHARTLARNGVGNERERPLRVAARVAQLLHDEQQHVDLANGSEPHRDLPQTSAELACQIAVQLENWQQFPQTTRRDTRAVNGPDVALLNAV